MSDKKRGFLGRLFGGKEAPESEPDKAPESVSDALEPDQHSALPSGDELAQDTAELEDSSDTDGAPVAASSSPEAEPTTDPHLGPRDETADESPEVPVSEVPVSEVLVPEEQALGDAEPEDTKPETDPLAGQAETVENGTEPGSDPVANAPAPVVGEGAKLSWFQRLKKGLSRSSSALTDGISSIFAKRKLDATMLEELEDILIQADLGVDTAMAITDRLSDGRYDKEISPEEVREILSEEVERVLAPVAEPLDLGGPKKPHVVLMVGVNGTGKTTTIGKLSKILREDGKTVMLAAGDTFRAAAVEQLKIWGQRTGAEVISRDTGADAAGLAFDAMKEATAKGVDVLLIDTAGRLQNKAELMDELEKVIRVIRKHDPDAPHTCLLTLDATTGQNALNQVEIFGKVAGVTGLVMTKLDGTARGGILVAISAKYGLPVHFIGVGEGVEDLEPFSAKDFASAIAGLA